jgi:uncharacterized protein with GYD domain
LDEGIDMATYITLLSFTDQGIRNVKESPTRSEAFIAMASKLGVSVKNIYWTTGSYDLVVVAEGNDEAVMAALLSLGALGNVRSQTLRAYPVADMKKIIGQMA